MEEKNGRGYLSLNTWNDIVNAVREKLGIDDWLKADEVADKIREIGTRDTLSEYLAEEVEDIVYYGDSLRSYAFYNDTNIKNFVAPNMTSLQTATFSNSNIRSIRCENVTTFNGASICDSCKYLEELYLPKAQIFAGQYTLRNCTALKTIELPEAKEMNGTFAGCTSLESVVLLSCVKITTGNNWLQNCTMLKELVIGTPNCTLSSAVGFPSNFKEKAVIYVPDDTVDTYKSATNWSTFADIIKPMSEREVAV